MRFSLNVFNVCVAASFAASAFLATAASNADEPASQPEPQTESASEPEVPYSSTPIASPTPACPNPIPFSTSTATDDPTGRTVDFVLNGEKKRLTLGAERVVVRGIRPEEQMWGAYQFPRPYNLDGRLLVAVHIANDDIKSFGETNRWFESRDNGETWNEVDPSVATECGLRLPNGDRLYFPMENGIDLTGYKTTPQTKYTPATDFTKRAPEGVLPIPDGATGWPGGLTLNAYDADRLPPSLGAKVWLAKRIPAGKSEPETEYVKVDWPRLTRVVHREPNKWPGTLKSIFPRGTPKLGPDGAIWVAVFSGEGHIDPETGKYSPYYSAEIFRSEDLGKSFQQRAHLEYPADGETYPYLSGGFSDSDFAFMPDGSIVWFLRSTWFGSTGCEWAPMYATRSTDGGRTWAKPRVFAEIGILPRLCQLANGTTLLCYARPGIFVRACEDDRGVRWSAPLEAMTPNDRSELANVVAEEPTFHDWDGACNNPEIIPLERDSALLVYSDFYYPDEDGVKRKTILCRKITVSDVDRQ